MANKGTIDRALAVLEEAAASNVKTQNKGVALALYVLRGHCPDDWLANFWDAAGSEHDIGRAQGTHAAFNGIAKRVRGEIK